NLFNFMDGIDGITGIEASTIGAGLFLLALFSGTDPGIGIFGLTITAAALGFLWWNWPPARIFIGDVGSAPLGFLLGWLLLGLAISGAWAAALILPLAYLTDATWTLLRRLIRGEKVWQAHAQHFYQRALGLGMRHSDVARFFLITDLGLVALALASTAKSFPGAPWLALSGACVLVFGLFHRLTRKNPEA
ncbi:MAG: UDP-N-acetylmuramyl pentapeptide phosphotransferase, partial [Rhodospirillaceae bacterium]|nr:UDP-N-acetylmuramyl pentapeptide phosphotransferase [Rhodospirillaceae bacterium]